VQNHSDAALQAGHNRGRFYPAVSFLDDYSSPSTPDAYFCRAADLGWRRGRVYFQGLGIVA
jgi:hypothetical protein